MKSSLIAMLLVFGAACGTEYIPDEPTGCMPGERMDCECSATSTGSMTCGADGAFGACGQCSVPDPDPMMVNFQAQIVPILNRSCGTGVNGCHGRDAYGASLQQECRGWLTLENEALGSKFYSGPRNGENTGCPDKTLHQRLTQIRVWQCLNTTAYYVKAGDLSQSYIINKLDGTNLCRESPTSPSDQMPPADQDNVVDPFVISTADKELIRQWIMEGALDN